MAATDLLLKTAAGVLREDIWPVFRASFQRITPSKFEPKKRKAGSENRFDEFYIDRAGAFASCSQKQ